MARGQAQYLRLFSGATTYARWQSYYTNATVLWEGQQWAWQPFDVDGLVEGDSGDESNLSIEIPATAAVVDIIQTALAEAWLVEARFYEFNTFAGNDAPQSGQVLIASAVGEVVAASGSFTSLKLTLGSSLSPVGAQAPPRTYTTPLVGAPCLL
jgi:hypothetical protein